MQKKWHKTNFNQLMAKAFWIVFTTENTTFLAPKWWFSSREIPGYFREM